jgi:hypothetical protein
MFFRKRLLGTLATLIAITSSISANTPQPSLHVGRIWTNPEYDGAEGWSGSILQYPAGIPIEADPWTNDGSLKRGWIGQGQKMGTYLFSTDWTDPDANFHEFPMSYFFRSMNYGYPPDWLPGTAGPSFNYLYGGGVQVYNRFARPNIFIDERKLIFHPGADSATVLPDHGGIGQYPLDIVDPTLVSERAVEMWWRYIQGVELRRTQYAYPYGSAHQDYILSDITLTNNGISGTTDAAPVLDGQTLNGVVWVQAYDYRNNNAPNGAVQVQNDNHGKYIEPFGTGNHAAVYFRDGDWDVFKPFAGFMGSDLGDPPITAYYNGHLLGNAHVMVGPVFVSQSSVASTADLPAQPAFRLIWGERGVDFAGLIYSSPTPANARETVTGGFNQLDIGVDMRDDPRTVEFATIGTGGTALLGYGPLNGALTRGNFADHGWTLGFGESVRIVQTMAAGGLDMEAAQHIGQRWIARRDANRTDLLTPEEIDLVLSGQDTVRKAMSLAYWNMNGQFPTNVTPDTLAKWGIASYETTKPAGRDPFDVPDAPRPPANVAVMVNWYNRGIQIRWGIEAETEPDFDTGVPDFERYRIYRQEGSRLAPWEIVFDGPVDRLIYADVDNNVPFAGREYWDGDVIPGVDYWYAVVAVDDGTQNWAEPGRKLESTRWWTWTGYGEAGVTSSRIYDSPCTAEPWLPWCPDAIASGHPVPFALHQNAPNPFNPTTTLRFSVADADHVNLAIYDAVGRHVRTIVDRVMPAGEHEIVWDGADASGRRLGSGVYVYRLTATGSDGTVQTATRKMLLVK